uniref:YTH domain-containing family protein n=1 Tax=Aegilops tauschii TaxID=37682 RepID=N1QSK2_AEGTA
MVYGSANAGNAQGAGLHVGMQKLSLEGKKDAAGADAAKPSGMQYGSANTGNSQTVEPHVDRSITPLLQEAMDPNFFYQPNGYPSPAYYYPSGYDGSTNEWDTRYAGHEGMEVPQSVYGDMYHGYGYAPYGPYPSGSPVPTVGHDGQSYGTQQYQYPGQYYQQPAPTNAMHGVNSANPQSELPSAAAHQAHATVVSAKVTTGTASGIANAASSLPRKQTHHHVSVTNSGSYGRGPSQGGPSASNFGHTGHRSPAQWYDGPVYSNGHQRSIASSTSYGSNSSSAKNQSHRPTTNLMGMHMHGPSSGMGLTSPSYSSRMYPDSRLYGQYGQYGNTLKAGLGFGSNVYNSRNNGQWGVVDTVKYKPRNRATFGFGSENQDGFTELNRGPRSGGFRHQKPFGPTVTIAVKGQVLPSAGKQDNSVLPDKSQFNQEGFSATYKDAKFFVIKSYSEDDVHKSIKYNVWASTPNGNKKLDAGYREAQEKSSECPVFLFFSVNTSGQFVGVAEMVGPVDFDKTVDYWQQDKWNGCFSIKWHIVKDIPNNILKHITLDNNDNKPVTNSRDTQEVKLEQGLQMLKIFKEHVSKTSILDDFAFYENRQKLMQEKRAKQQPLQGQASVGVDEKEKSAVNGNSAAQKQTPSKESTTPAAGEEPNASKPTTAESGGASAN